MATYKKYTIRYVDGFKIRNTLDDDFGVIGRYSTAIAHFSPKYYIPPNEIWIDAPFHQELDFFLTSEFYTDEHPEFKKMSYHKVREHLKKELCLAGPLPHFKKHLHSSDPEIILVDGKVVRAYLDPDFIFGGHEYVYDYVPKNEIWLDQFTDPQELPFIEHHEKIERNLMKAGATYDEAHDIASAEEKRLRRHRLGTAYPGDTHFPWYGLENDELVRQFYV